jgi:glycyl-tRNA synthetase beta chain
MSAAAAGNDAVVAPLVVELLTEELPPKALRRLGTAFADALLTALRTRGVLDDGATVTAYATPRRLAAAIDAVRAVAPDREVEQKLMPLAVASTTGTAEGQPSQALQRKLAGMGRPGLATAFPDGVHGGDRLFVRRDGKADALFLRSTQPGATLRDALQAALEDAIAALPIPKVMSYGAVGSYYNDVRFVRPAHRLLALHGADVVAVEALGLAAGRTSAGHRFLSRADLEVATAAA